MNKIRHTLPDAVVVRIFLASSLDEYIKNKIRLLSDKMNNNNLDEYETKLIASLLKEISKGTPIEKIFGTGKTKGGQRKDHFHKWMAIDYWLRSELKLTKVSAHIAVDWKQTSVRTVCDIARRKKPISQKVIAKWKEDLNSPLLTNLKELYEQPLSRYLEALNAVRHELLTGESLPIIIGKHQEIEIVSLAEELLQPHPEIMS